MEHILLQLLIFLGAAVIAVPIAKRFGLGSVLGYLIAGIIIGPFGLSLIGEIEEVMHFTEFGVVMMLFLVGLELKPSLLWKMKTPILGMGGTQVIITTGVITLCCLFFLPWQYALAIGLTLSLSSTALVLQTLREKGLMNTNPGRSIFSVLLFQDLAVIPMLALLPLLATVAVQHGDSHHGTALFDITSLPTSLRIVVVLAAVGAIFLLGKYGSRPLFRAIAATRVREVFVAAALALVIGISLLMTLVGLSPALGTFLAGVVLADSEYRHELESDIEPFKGLLLGIFFIAIGASLNFSLISEQVWLITGLVSGLILIKFLVLLVTSLVFKIPRNERFLFSIALAQGGEFAFVLFQFARSNGVLPRDLIETLVSAVAISMFLTPLFFLLYDRLVAPKMQEPDESREPDAIEHGGRKVILAGFGRLGTDLGRLLISAGIKPVILDNNETNVDVLRSFGFEVYYGDVTRLDLLESAGAAEAELLVITLGDRERAVKLVKLVQKHYPKLEIAANASDRAAVYALMDLGVRVIKRETFGSALSLGREALQILGYSPYEAYRLTRLFNKKDEDHLPELYRSFSEDRDNYATMYRQHNEDLATLIRLDEEEFMEELDKAWTAQNPET